MKVAMINPPFMDGRFSRTSRSPAINKSGTLYWPFWLAHGTGALEAAGHEVLFLDCPAEGISEKALLEKLVLPSQNPEHKTTLVLSFNDFLYLILLFYLILARNFRVKNFPFTAI